MRFPPVAWRARTAATRSARLWLQGGRRGQRDRRFWVRLARFAFTAEFAAFAIRAEASIPAAALTVCLVWSVLW
jgi:hypothetical protein